MGSAVHTARGETRLGLSATAAAAVLYGAVVLLGLGPASPVALGTSDDLPTPVVHVTHDSAVSGPAQRLPQVSPGPVRHHVQHRRHRAAGAVTESTPRTLLPDGSAATDTPGAGSTPPQPGPTHPAPSAPPPTSVPVVAVAIPDVTVPAVDSPQAPTLPALPPTPSLPPPPSLPALPSVPLP